MLQLVCTAIDQYVRIFKVQYHTANCHYYKNIPCKMKCVKKSTTLNSPNNRNRNMYSAAHIRHSYERKGESRRGLNSTYSPGRREFKLQLQPRAEGVLTPATAQGGGSFNSS